MIQRIIVLGGGSAGFLAAISLRVRLPKVPVTVIRSKEIGIIGVGEGSTLAFPLYLHGYLKADATEFVRAAKPTWKLGLRFLSWGPRPFFDYTFAPQLHVRWNDLAKPIGFYVDEEFEFANLNSALCSANRVFAKGRQGEPLVKRDFGYHVENVNFVAFLEQYAARVGIEIVEDTVEEVMQDERGVSGLKLRSGRVAAADLYVDSSGFASLLLGKALGERFISYKPTLYCDRAVVGGWERGQEPIRPYTTVEGMESGWCWQIDHEHRINRGYVYSSSFISDEDARRELVAKNPKITETRVVKFVSGRYERCWVKNVVAIGNASGFVEPLEATSLGAICDESYALAELLADCDMDPGEQMVRQYNKRCGTSWDLIRNFLAIHYRFNTRFDTPFWRECREKVELFGAAEMVEYFQENGPSTLFRQNLLLESDPFKMEGYLTLLVGQKVPYRKKYVPTAAEAATWGEIRAYLRAQGRAGYTIGEALENVRSGKWSWGADFFKQNPFTVGG